MRERFACSRRRKRYLPFIETEFPHSAARYRAAYASDSDIGARYQAGLAQVVRRLCARYRVRNWAAEHEQAPQQASTTLGVSLVQPTGISWRWCWTSS